ncbi:MAG: diphosphatase [Microbacteriaceae bacterium]|nr:diphosphatase [Microbacteriaceae bacterium]
MSPLPLNALPLSALPLSRSELDRDYLARSRPGLFDELWNDETTRVVVLRKGSALLASPNQLSLLPASSVPPTDLRLYLGRATVDSTPDVAIVAAILDEEGAATLSSDPADWGSLRSLGTTLSDLDAGIFTTALGLANWHDTHQFSPRTGQKTVPELGGWVRRGLDDGTDMFPRTDAAIIVGITDSEDRILLGSNAMWAKNRYSLLAGFVEPGESLESAVIREVFEESGIRVVDPQYLGSQPWPFPASLMLGFLAKVDPSVTSTLEPDGEEILDLRWFSRQELVASLGEIALPGHTSIARAILEHWYGGPIDDGIDW